MSRKTEVVAALRGVDGVSGVFAQFPKSGVKFPCISYKESSRNVFIYADDVPYLWNVHFDVDVFGKDSDDIDSIAESVIDKMGGIGFDNIAIQNVYAANSPKKISMRFKGFI